MLSILFIECEDDTATPRLLTVQNKIVFLLNSLMGISDSVDLGLAR